MTFAQTLTALAPALIMGFLWIVTKFSPPSLEGSQNSQSPEWWRRDQKTWDLAQRITARKYALFALIITIFCITTLFFDWPFSSMIGYGLLIFFFLLAQYQVRSYMNVRVK